MSTIAQYVSQITIGITSSNPFADPADATVTLDGMNTTIGLNDTTTPAVTKGTIFAKALSTGAGTIDLTSMPGITVGDVVDGTGLKVQMAKFANPAGNAAITVTFGASNPYLILGAAFKFILLAGQELTIYGNNATPTIGSGAKAIDISGTGSQVLNVEVAMG